MTVFLVLITGLLVLAVSGRSFGDSPLIGVGEMLPDSVYKSMVAQELSWYIGEFAGLDSGVDRSLFENAAFSAETASFKKKLLSFRVSARVKDYHLRLVLLLVRLEDGFDARDEVAVKSAMSGLRDSLTQLSVL